MRTKNSPELLGLGEKFRNFFSVGEASSDCLKGFALLSRGLFGDFGAGESSVPGGQDMISRRMGVSFPPSDGGDTDKVFFCDLLECFGEGEAEGECLWVTVRDGESGWKTTETLCACFKRALPSSEVTYCWFLEARLVMKERTASNSPMAALVASIESGLCVGQSVHTGRSIHSYSRPILILLQEPFLRFLQLHPVGCQYTTRTEGLHTLDGAELVIQHRASSGHTHRNQK